MTLDELAEKLRVEAWLSIDARHGTVEPEFNPRAKTLIEEFLAERGIKPE